jgi:mRNA-degrading endonuclease RelE of RelBE toxin-antitoxin system/DNA-directed RNA polymerase subunit RPC12/RpoP
MRTTPKRSTHFTEWDRLDKEQRKRVTDWLDTPTKLRAKQAFRILLKLQDQTETVIALGVRSTTAYRYLKDVRDCFRMILSDNPFEHICSTCGSELDGELSSEHTFKVHRGSCERCWKHAALIPIQDYGLNKFGVKE